jgi:nicotinic acid phosphoribosyltransferase
MRPCRCLFFIIPSDLFKLFARTGGFDSTSNVYAAQVYGIAAAGTMAHSFIES